MGLDAGFRTVGAGSGMRSASGRSGKRHATIAVAVAVVMIGTTAVTWGSAGHSRALDVSTLETNAAEEPLGIDDATPRLSWALEGSLRGVVQTGFRVLVATSEARLREGKADVWDSRFVGSADPWVVYAGRPLDSRTRYYWTVRVFANRGAATDYAKPTWFETAYLSASEWQGEWISGPQRLEVPRTGAQGQADDACCLPWTSLSVAAAEGATNIKVPSVAGFAPGGSIDVGSGADKETVTVTEVGTAAAVTSLVRPASEGDGNLKVASVAGLAAGDEILVDTGAGQEARTIAAGGVGTAAGPATTLVSAAPAGARNVKVPSVNGFVAGQEILVDTGAALESRTVTAVGTQARSTTLVKPAAAGDSNVKVASVTGISAGDTILVDTGAKLEERTASAVGTAAGANTTLFADAAPGDTNVEVANAAGFAVGDEILIDGGEETRTITAVGSQGRITALAAPANAGDTNIKVASVTGLAVGDRLTLNTGAKIEKRTISSVGTAGETGTGVTLDAPLSQAHTATTQVWDPGTGITFTPALEKSHTAQTPVRGSGSGITLSSPLDQPHAYAAAVNAPGSGVTFSPALDSAHATGATVRGAGTGVTLDSPLGRAHEFGAAVQAPRGGVTFEPALRNSHPSGSLVAKSSGDYCRLPGGGNTSGSCREVRPAPLLRKSFVVTKPVESARIYSAGLAYNDMSVNGRQTSDSVLDPAFTNYADTVLYTTHDVTKLIRRGENVLATQLGSGQFDDETTSNDWHWEDAEWRATPQVRADLRIRYRDGTEQVVKTDDSWKVTLGPTRYDGYYLGETYDARKAIPDWNTPGFNAASWDPVRVVPGPTGELQAQKVEATTVVREWPAGVRTEPQPGIVLYDTGQQVAGWATVKVWGARAGTPIQIHYAERLNAAGLSANQGFTAQGQIQTDIYIAKGTGTRWKPEVFTPRFTYKGFQHVQISSPSNPATQAGGTAQPLPPGVHVAVDSVHEVRTPMRETGRFDSSSRLLDRIERNTRAAVAENYVAGIITDTPVHEKNAWTGDASLTAPTASLMFDTERQFWKNYRDMFDNQVEATGEVTLLAPTNDGYGHLGQTFKRQANQGATPIWDSFWFVLPWEAYLRYGDLRGLDMTYPLMRKHLDDWVTTMTPLDGDGYEFTLTSGLGDWLPPDGFDAGGVGPTGVNLNAGNANTIISPSSTAYYAYMAKIAADSARALGKTAEAAHFDEVYSNIKRDFNARWWDADVGYYRERPSQMFTQGLQVFALAFGLVPEDERRDLTEKLIHDITVTRAGHEMVGVASARWILPVLSDAAYDGVPGAADAAYEIALQTSYPSYGFWAEELGWTSLGEEWESNSRTRTHHFYGSVSQWFYENLAGIQPLEPGYAKVAFKPTIASGLDHASASYDSVRGRVSASWRKKGWGSKQRLEIDVTVPANATGLVYVPGTDPAKVTESGSGRHVPAAKADGVDLVGVQGDHVVFEVESGSYEFSGAAGT